MRTQLLPAFRLMLLLTMLLGVGYPLAITGVCQLLFPHQANGSQLGAGSELIGQNFIRPEYFHPRPSSAGSGYDAAASGASNLGPTSARLLYGAVKVDRNKEVVDFDGLSLRVVRYCVENGIPIESSRPFDPAAGDVQLIKAFNDAKAPLRVHAKYALPSDAVTGSASGLDPDISPMNAELQAARVAKARGVAIGQVHAAITAATETPLLGFIGEPRVNVLRLNLALDNRLPVRRNLPQ